MTSIDQSQKEKIKGWARIFALIIPYFFVVGMFQLFGALLVGIDFSEPGQKETLFQDLVILSFGTVGTFLILWIFMKYVDQEPFIKLGFETSGRWSEFVLGFFIGLLTMALGFLVLIFLNEIIVEKIFFDPKELLLLTLLFAVVALVEEMLIRGYVLKNFMLSFNNYVALIISSLIFSLMHGFNEHFDYFAFINLFLAGLVLGISYIYTQNLWLPISMHFSWNLFQSLFGFNVSGKETYSIVVLKIEEYNRINGGPFGLEGSYFVTLAEIITLIALGIYFHKKNKKPILG